MSRTIKITDWAKEEFDEPVPSYPTLIKFAKNGMISPQPVKAGRHWRVERTARFVGMAVRPIVKKDDDPRLKRILEDGATT
ncbi:MULTISPECIES: excisionase [Serratia]|uniref:excisionase n=1 Tax=Serratia TaxID=613 RepID=UPI0014155910|nr:MULTISPECIES: excisionase [Serratia]QIP93099.1 excisionase [Serratia fonticola]UAN58032.1 excisionase [Serratia sp. JSRIV004]